MTFSMVSERKAARLLNISVGTLRRARRAGIGPACVETKSRFYYNLELLTNWVKGDTQHAENA